jgi:hypothetical protein
LGAELRVTAMQQSTDIDSNGQIFDVEGRLGDCCDCLADVLRLVGFENIVNQGLCSLLCETSLELFNQGRIPLDA